MLKCWTGEYVYPINNRRGSKVETIKIMKFVLF